MDRHRHPRLDQRGRLGGPPGIEVALAERGAVAGDRQQREVHGAQVPHLVEQVGVAREVDRALGADDEPERRRRRAAGPACALVLGAGRLDADVAELHRLAGQQLIDLLVAGPRDQPGGAGRTDRTRTRLQHPQRG
jgi:hypothetical protein